MERLPANSSSISDGRYAHLLMRESTAKVRRIKAMAKIVGHATHAQALSPLPPHPLVQLNN